MSAIWLLEEGYFYDQGGVICAAKYKKNILKWVKEHRPGFKRSRAQEKPGELCFEHAKEGMWIRCSKQVKLIEEDS